MTSMVERLFGVAANRTKHVCLLGLENSGRTAALYRWKEGRFVTTFPTVGFNLEMIKRHGYDFSMRDLGGGMNDHFRHFRFEDVSAVLFFVDANDFDRLDAAVELLQENLAEKEFRANRAVFVVALSKVDLLAQKENRRRCVTENDIREKLGRIPDQIFNYEIPIIPCSARTGQGLDDVLQWLAANTQEEKRKELCKEWKDDEKIKSPSTTLEEWLQREHETDEEFLAKLHAYTLERWDHYSRLRVAHILLKRHGRREGMKRIFAHIRDFLIHAPLATLQVEGEKSSTTFHETKAYFWTHMLHYCMESTTHGSEEEYEEETNAKSDSFKDLLVSNPQLTNKELFLEYFSKDAIDAAPARVTVVLPDLRPLPSLLTNLQSLGKDENDAGDSAQDTTKGREQENEATLDNDTGKSEYAQQDVDFWTAVLGGRSPSMGHDARLRTIWCALTLGSDRNMSAGRKLALDVLRDQMYGVNHFHLTENYFWVQVMCLLLALEYRAWASYSYSYRDFVLRAEAAIPRLGDATFVHEYYSPALLDTAKAKEEFVVPDKKTIPDTL